MLLISTEEIENRIKNVQVKGANLNIFKLRSQPEIHEYDRDREKHTAKQKCLFVPLQIQFLPEKNTRNLKCVYQHTNLTSFTSDNGVPRRHDLMTRG